MAINYNLDRFVEAQENTYRIALSELQRGEKQSHWMWYIFPQIAGLGQSSNSKFYSLKSSDEARMYLHHEILGKRLKEITQVVLELENKSAYRIFDNPDYLKFKSCMTLFAFVSEEESLFHKALDKYFEGKNCDMTVYFLQTE